LVTALLTVHLIPLVQLVNQLVLLQLIFLPAPLLLSRRLWMYPMTRVCPIVLPIYGLSWRLSRAVVPMS
jgi:hypothetical protein